MASSARSALGCALSAGLLAGSLAAAPAAADDTTAAAGAVELNLLSINDFHGRIDTNTVKFAGTVEKLRAENPQGTLFTSAGDNIGASVFASSVQRVRPTIDVLNALDLAASAVGNHEFDAGFEDLTGRVAAAAEYPQLGANVYRRGTTTPALQEYLLVPVNGLTVGVIGAVTEETSTLVSPGGIASVEFGVPVGAVNRVAAQLSDGTGDEAGVIVASYHEGAGTAAGLAEATAASPVFNRVVNGTSPEVDVIFNGHTHLAYSFEAPVPGGAGRTRPGVQTGSYGENIGQVRHSVDPASGDVLSHAAAVVRRSTEDDAALAGAYPRAAEVRSIVDAALAHAGQVGAEQVGTATADITSAFADTNGDGTAERDDRAAESTLGNLVADSLLASLSPDERGGAEIGVVNPGGLRNELYYAPDGRITYAEANAVLPFLNNLWTTTLTGAQLKTMLEQQWQRAAAGTVPARPYLQLCLSRNEHYTYGPDLPEGSRITGVWVNGEPLDPQRGYRVGTFSFLAQGGDNFRVFTQGSSTRDSGLIDRDAWIAYLGANSPLSPDFARRSTVLQGAPARTGPRQQVSVKVPRLDLTSLGSPANTRLTLAYVDARGESRQLGSYTVPDGAADVSSRAPASLRGGYFELTAAESGTTVRLPSAVPAKANPGLERKARP
ncbi:bifunctional metallophosphatase/5'-nucleotidase [Arthrobacter deserti]|uniref:Bifunctional metallophosphatase/5'-nucleotidase n=1 Tax=Arthrobacter deserti TaxID=1742687 RepID=A0ABX1JKF6_9MICC|nr:bifunctional metallophosphatase/5'-nucleotidase [Arthrobacter deserti]